MLADVTPASLRAHADSLTARLRFVGRDHNPLQLHAQSPLVRCTIVDDS